MSLESRTYTVSLAKGQGMIDETMALFSLWKPGMTAAELGNRAVQEGAFARGTAKRIKDMVRGQFGPRFIGNNGKAAKQIKILIETGGRVQNLKQIFFLHTARANAVLYDFVCEVYWLAYEAGRDFLSKADALNFLKIAADNGRLPNKWSEIMINRIASYLGGCLADFGLLENVKKSSRRILPFKIDRLTALYLVHDIHFSGLSENNVVDHRDWCLFGMTRSDVVREIQLVSNGHLIPQFSGDLVRISWQYKTLEESFYAIGEAEL